MSEQEI
jgi:SMC interacting uncharacterized protein involved in chromosome segregation